MANLAKYKIVRSTNNYPRLYVRESKLFGLYSTWAYLGSLYALNEGDLKIEADKYIRLYEKSLEPDVVEYL